MSLNSSSTQSQWIKVLRSIDPNREYNFSIFLAMDGTYATYDPYGMTILNWLSAGFKSDPQILCTEAVGLILEHKHNTEWMLKYGIYILARITDQCEFVPVIRLIKERDSIVDFRGESRPACICALASIAAWFLPNVSSFELFGAVMHSLKHILSIQTHTQCDSFLYTFFYTLQYHKNLVDETTNERIQPGVGMLLDRLDIENDFKLKGLCGIIETSFSLSPPLASHIIYAIWSRVNAKHPKEIDKISRNIVACIEREYRHIHVLWSVDDLSPYVSRVKSILDLLGDRFMTQTPSTEFTIRYLVSFINRNNVVDVLEKGDTTQILRLVCIVRLYVHRLIQWPKLKSRLVAFERYIQRCVAVLISSMNRNSDLDARRSIRDIINEITDIYAAAKATSQRIIPTASGPYQFLLVPPREQFSPHYQRIIDDLSTKLPDDLVVYTMQFTLGFSHDRARQTELSAALRAQIGWIRSFRLQWHTMHASNKHPREASTR